jgi:hypothetical protein
MHTNADAHGGAVETKTCNGTIGGCLCTLAISHDAATALQLPSQAHNAEQMKHIASAHVQCPTCDN